MLNKEDKMFCFKCFKWLTDNAAELDEQDIRTKLKYMTRSFYQKELIDSYLAGRRGVSHRRTHSEPQWMFDEDRE